MYNPNSKREQIIQEIALINGLKPSIVLDIIKSRDKHTKDLISSGSIVQMKYEYLGVFSSTQWGMDRYKANVEAKVARTKGALRGKLKSKKEQEDNGTIQPRE